MEDHIYILFCVHLGFDFFYNTPGYLNVAGANLLLSVLVANVSGEE